MPLKQFKGYYVDYRLRQFRSVAAYPAIIEFIDFDSDKGKTILEELQRTDL